MSAQPQQARRVPLIVDVDTGIDDALALLYLFRCGMADILAVTCVAGNVDVDRVAANTLAVLDTVDAPPTPVARGAARPLVAPPRDAHGFHGENGLGGIQLPASRREIAGEPAAQLMRDKIAAAAQHVTILGLGPLTNLALLIRLYPEEARKVERIVFMGGAIAAGNAAPLAEFNAWHDPESLHIVLTSGVPTTMYCLDAFQHVALPDGTAHRLTGHPDPAARLAGRLLHEGASREDGREMLGDAGAACLVVDRTLCQLTPFPVRVELSGGSRGQTVVDRRPRVGESEHHGTARRPEAIDVATEVDAPRMQAAFLDAITGRCPPPDCDSPNTPKPEVDE